MFTWQYSRPPELEIFSGKRLLPIHRREILKKIFQSISGFQIIPKCFNRYTGSMKDRYPTENVIISCPQIYLISVHRFLLPSWGPHHAVQPGAARRIYSLLISARVFTENSNSVSPGPDRFLETCQDWTLL